MSGPPAPYVGAKEYIPMDERIARTMNSYADRGTVMHAPHQAVTSFRQVSGLNQGQEPQSSKYLVPIPGTGNKFSRYGMAQAPNADPDDPKNPMNSLNYLYGR